MNVKLLFFVEYFLCLDLVIAISGGKKVPKHVLEVEYSFNVAITKVKHVQDSDLFCGGAFIDRKAIIVAAHCFRKQASYDNYQVVVGDPGRFVGTYLTIDNVYKHDKYHGIIGGYDVAVVILKQPIDFLTLFLPVAPIALPSGKVEAGDMMTFLGWGATRIHYGIYRYPKFLQVIKIPIINYQTCKEYIEDRDRRKVINPTLICAGFFEEGVLATGCSGDSGSPLFIKKGNHYELYGIFSWGYGCNEKGVPNGFTDLTKPSIRKFIEEHRKK